MASIPKDTYQAIVWLLARVSERDDQLSNAERRIARLEQGYARLENENQQLRQQLNALSERMGISTTDSELPSSSPTLNDHAPFTAGSATETLLSVSGALSTSLRPSTQHHSLASTAQEHYPRMIHLSSESSQPDVSRTRDGPFAVNASSASISDDHYSNGSGGNAAADAANDTSTAAMPAFLVSSSTPTLPLSSQAQATGNSQPVSSATFAQQPINPPGTHIMAHGQMQVLPPAPTSSIGPSDRRATSNQQSSPATAHTTGQTQRPATTLITSQATVSEKERLLGSPWIKYGLDKGSYTLIRDYLRGTLKQTLVQNNAINGHRFHKDARLADPVNITFRQAVTQQIMELGERSGIHLPFETVEKRVSVYLQNYREEAKKTPSELAADRRSKRLRSKQRRDEARQRRINEAAMQIQSIQQN